MRTWAKGAKPAAMLAVGVMAFGGSGAALADTGGDHSVGGGNQLNLPVTLPIDISGNAVGVLGDAEAQSRGGAVADVGGSPTRPGRTSGESSVLGGNQVTAPITAPINACGNAVSLFGRSEAGCEGGAKAKAGGGGGQGAGGNRTSGRSSLGGGNQVVARITAPINACGNAVAVFGDAVAGCKGGAEARGGAGQGAGDNRTSGRSSVLGGNQAVAPVTAPVNVCGAAVGALGNAFAGCTGGAKVRGGKGATGQGAGGNRTSGRSSVLGGNQAVAPVTAPINACGTAAGVLGRSEAACAGGAKVVGDVGQGAGGNRTSGRGSVLGGNQAVAPITAPVNACGNTAAVLGDAAAGCLGSAKVTGGGNHHGYGARKASSVRHTSGLMSVAPLTTAVGGAEHAHKKTYKHAPGRPKLPGTTAHGLAPVPGGLPQAPGRLPALPGGLAELPNLPFVSALPVASTLPTAAEGAAKAPAKRDAVPLDADLVSAEQPAGLTGMNAGALLALALGGLFAASATLFAFTRRLRPRRR